MDADARSSVAAMHGYVMELPTIYLMAHGEDCLSSLVESIPQTEIRSLI
jgi:hypothetical protein